MRTFPSCVVDLIVPSSMRSSSLTTGMAIPQAGSTEMRRRRVMRRMAPHNLCQLNLDQLSRMLIRSDHVAEFGFFLRQSKINQIKCLDVVHDCTPCVTQKPEGHTVWQLDDALFACCMSIRRATADVCWCRTFRSGTAVATGRRRRKLVVSGSRPSSSRPPRNTCIPTHLRDPPKRTRRRISTENS